MCGQVAPPPSSPPARSGSPSRTGSRVLPWEESSGMAVVCLFKLQTRSESLPQNLQARLHRPRFSWRRSGPREVRACTEAKKPELDPPLRTALPTSALSNLGVCLPGSFPALRRAPLCRPLAELVPNQNWLGLAPPLVPWVTLGASAHLTL